LIAIGGETVDLTGLLGEDYGLHKGMIGRLKRQGQSEAATSTKKRGSATSPP